MNLRNNRTPVITKRGPSRLIQEVLHDPAPEVHQPEPAAMNTVPLATPPVEPTPVPPVAG